MEQILSWQGQGQTPRKALRPKRIGTVIIKYLLITSSALIVQLHFGNQKACLIKLNVYTFT